MIEGCELVSLEKNLGVYRSKLRESDDRKIAFVFGPHKWILDHDQKMVRAGRMSLKAAEQRRYKCVIRCLLEAQRLHENNQHRDNEFDHVRAEYRKARAKELQALSVQP